MTILSKVTARGFVFRRQAEDCRQQAAKAVSPLDREAWLRVAEEWLKLAVSADGRPRAMPLYSFAISRGGQSQPSSISDWPNDD
jgi:hypothetical protein